MLFALTVTVNLVDAVVRDQVCKLCRFTDCRFKSLFWFYLLSDVAVYEHHLETIQLHSCGSSNNFPCILSERGAGRERERG